MLERSLSIVKDYWKTFTFLIATAVFVAIGLHFEWDKQIMAGFVVLFGIISQAFAGLAALIALVPFVGPLIVKILSIPFFWLLNGIGWFVSLLIAKKGYGSSVVQGRVLTTALLVGVIIGFILGKLL